YRHELAVFAFEVEPGLSHMEQPVATSYWQLLVGSTGQDQSYVVGLLFRADPVLDGRNRVFADALQRQGALRSDGLHPPGLAEFAELVLWFGHAITECDKHGAGMELHRVLPVFTIVEKADNSASHIEAAGGTIFAQDDRGKMAGVRVREAPAFIVVETEKERGVLLRLRGRVEMPVQEPEHLGR